MSYKREKISRRKFLTSSAKTAAGLVTAGALASSAAAAGVKGRVLGANEHITAAIVGIGGRNSSFLRSFNKTRNASVKTVCDIDENRFGEYAKRTEDAQGFAPTTEYDLRNLYDDKDIDAVYIATTNHWHALATIWACQAGKHVLVEKPSSHNIWEGRKMVEAARKYNCRVQVGFQRRSNPNEQRFIKFIQSGELGEIYMARGLCLKPRGNIGKYPDSSIPEGVHYDIWLGPAPKRPFNRNRFHYNWHWHWDYGNGDIGNTGPHQLDMARWGLNKHEYPVNVKSVGGYFAFDSAQETPNIQTAVFEYADGKILQFEVRGLYTNAEDKVTVGNLFFGTKGWAFIREDGTWGSYFGRKNEPGPSGKTIEEEGYGYGDRLFEDFINAVRSGKNKDLTCDIEVGHRSTVLAHLANISYRLGRDLTFNGAEEKFVGDPKADAMLTRDYRKPYVVPEKV